MRKILFFTVFISGMTSLGIEMAVSRLVGTFFGTSNLVWASIIGLILIYLAIGYYLGGKWADRSPDYKTLYFILIAAAISIAFIPIVSQPVLRAAANAFDLLQMGVLFGSFFAVMILLIIPMTLLGTISPFAIRLAVQDMQDIGSVSGRIYAVSTLGSFIGAFLPVLVLIPTIGTYKTFLVFSFLILMVSLIGLWKISSKQNFIKLVWIILLPPLFWFNIQHDSKHSQGQIYETESAYNYIQVLEIDGFRYLRLNEGQGVHSIYHPTQLNYMGPWEQVSVAPFFNPAPYEPDNVKRLAIVGLAAGTTARQATEIFGPIPIDGYEIDPKIVEVGRTFFNMNEPNLNTYAEDGRWGLEHSDFHYQIISIDAYRPPYIPFHLTTQEFFKIVHDHLTEDGVMVINVGRSIDDRSLIDALGTTILTIFPSVHVIDIPNSFNSIMFATVQPTNSANLADNFIYLKDHPEISPLLLNAMQIAIGSMQPPPAKNIVFTDDRAPIEWITNNMILSFLFSGDMEMLQ